IGRRLGADQTADRIDSWLAARNVVEVTAKLTSPVAETTVKITRTNAGRVPDVSETSANRVFLPPLAERDRWWKSGFAFQWTRLACAGGGGVAKPLMSVWGIAMSEVLTNVSEVMDNGVWPKAMKASVTWKRDGVELPVTFTLVPRRVLAARAKPRPVVRSRGKCGRVWNKVPASLMLTGFRTVGFHCSVTSYETRLVTFAISTLTVKTAPPGTPLFVEGDTRSMVPETAFTRGMGIASTANIRRTGRIRPIVGFNWE